MAVWSDRVAATEKRVGLAEVARTRAEAAATVAGDARRGAEVAAEEATERAALAEAARAEEAGLVGFTI
jgi:hypothetical protein